MGVSKGQAELRFVEAALAKAVEIVQFAHHSHAFGDEHCTSANCSVAEFLETTVDPSPERTDAEWSAHSDDWHRAGYRADCPACIASDARLLSASAGYRPR